MNQGQNIYNEFLVSGIGSLTSRKYEKKTK